MNTRKALNDAVQDLPKLNQLLELEDFAKKNGSGIKYESLLGLWRFVSVWNKEGNSQNPIASSLLRIFSASLELRKNQLNGKIPIFELKNSIRFGLLRIEFIGYGELQGSQPLLIFYFEKIGLNLKESVIFSRSLEVPIKKDRPFFSLITLDEDMGWLSARGRGGGLALWLKD